MTWDDVRRAAAAAGLERLTEADLDLLARSIVANREMISRLPRDLHWSEEIAPVLRLRDQGVRGT